MLLFPLVYPLPLQPTTRNVCLAALGSLQGPKLSGLDVFHCVNLVQGDRRENLENGGQSQRKAGGRNWRESYEPH